MTLDSSHKASCVKPGLSVCVIAAACCSETWLLDFPCGDLGKQSQVECGLSVRKSCLMYVRVYLFLGENRLGLYFYIFSS